MVVSQSILQTSKPFAMEITPIEKEWIQHESEDLYTVYKTKWQQISCGVKVAPVLHANSRSILGPGHCKIDQLTGHLTCPHLALVENPANNPRFLPFHQVVFQGIGGINALLNGTRLMSIAAAIRRQLVPVSIVSPTSSIISDGLIFLAAVLTFVMCVVLKI